jgi:hypothetical protein
MPTAIRDEKVSSIDGKSYRQPTKLSVKIDSALDEIATTKYIFLNDAVTDEIIFFRDVKQIVNSMWDIETQSQY